MADTGIIQAIGGAIQAASAINAASQQNKTAQKAEAERVAENARRAKESDPTTMLANIMKLKQSLSKEQQAAIVRAVKGDSQLFNEAANVYLQSRQQPVLRGQPTAAPYGDTSKAVTGAFDSLANLLKKKKTDDTGLLKDTGQGQSYFDMVGAQETAPGVGQEP